jgi:hypothetical protein
MGEVSSAEEESGWIIPQVLIVVRARVVAPNAISIPQTVMNLLNTPVTNQTKFALVNR